MDTAESQQVLDFQNHSFADLMAGTRSWWEALSDFTGLAVGVCGAATAISVSKFPDRMPTRWSVAAGKWGLSGRS
ncbi:hypothetical protein [Nocardia sp. 348MFTsu5.1]|uniref:hypothetical protein n=1 Tax=Nocardia sp. 348MFTsu5.1 TaxID=1172185 RepID=UPI000378FAAD|nr:hypothetical protein [Nocardia sp. 348MFTsu5.1]